MLKHGAPESRSLGVILLARFNERQVAAGQRIVGIGLERALILCRRRFTLACRLLEEPELSMQHMITTRSVGVSFRFPQQVHCPWYRRRIAARSHLRVGQAE